MDTQIETGPTGQRLLPLAVVGAPGPKPGAPAAPGPGSSGARAAPGRP
jgi:hypothetical protein